MLKYTHFFSPSEKGQLLLSVSSLVETAGEAEFSHTFSRYFKLSFQHLSGISVPSNTSTELTVKFTNQLPATRETMKMRRMEERCEVSLGNSCNIQAKLSSEAKEGFECPCHKSKTSYGDRIKTYRSQRKSFHSH